MRRIVLAAAAALLVTSCDLIHHVVTLTFNDAGDLVTISTSTKFGEAERGTADYDRIAQAREALLAGRDEWSLRFAAAEPDTERLVYDRRHGELDRVEHSAVVPVDNIQKFFFDTPLSITVTRGEGWCEMTIYPGSSMRASRMQRERVEKTLAAYSGLAAQYFNSVRTMYMYLEEKPQRALPMFQWLFDPDQRDDKPPLSDREQGFVKEVRDKAEALTSFDSDGSIDRDFDSVFNPFPAELHVVTPSEPLAYEGFTRTRDSGLVARPVEVLQAVAMLEGRWISPDPLTVLFASDDKEKDPSPAATMAGMPRKAAVTVSASEIADALLEKMKPAPRYRVRWITKQPVN